MCSVWNTQYIAVSPIRGGSLLRMEKATEKALRFPHTRGKFTKLDATFFRYLKFPPYAGEVYLVKIYAPFPSRVSPIRGGSLPVIEALAKASGVSPIRGGSLPYFMAYSRFCNRFPHTRGKFTEVDGVEPENG